MVIAEDQLKQALERVRPHLQPSPLIRSPFLSEQLAADVFLKLETLQPTRSFKVRGAFNALLSLAPERRRQGVVAASQGNHGLGVALAASRLGVPATVYLPRQTAAARVAALRELGAEVVLWGDSWDEANREARRSAGGGAGSRAYVHPFDDPQVMAGQGTILLEALEQRPRIDLVVAAIGGGGLVAGLASAAHHFSPTTRLAGAETKGADCMYRSRRAGALVELEAITSIAKSLGARRSEPHPFQIVQRHVADLAVVSDRQAVEAMTLLLREEKLLAEPAAGCCVAALLDGQVPVRQGESVVIVLCGANVTLGETLELARTFEVPLQ